MSRRVERPWAASFLVAVMASACSGPVAPTPTPTPTPPPTPTPTPTTPPLPITRVQMSGRVFDENGVPVAGASVEVDYLTGGGASTPPSNCFPAQAPFCWLLAHTNNLGEYSVEFNALPWQNRGLGYAYAFADGHEMDVQWVPVGASQVLRNMRIPTTRALRPGDSTLVTVDSTSSLCTDLEDLFVMTSRCEIVVIESGPGTLVVETQAVSGTVTPSFYWYTSGNYAGFITRPAPGMVSIPVRGGSYRILVALPDGAAAQQFTVTTSLR